MTGTTRGFRPALLAVALAAGGGAAAQDAAPGLGVALVILQEEGRTQAISLSIGAGAHTAAETFGTGVEDPSGGYLISSGVIASEGEVGSEARPDGFDLFTSPVGTSGVP